MARTPKSPLTLPSSETKAPVTEPGAVREVSFSPEALEAVIARATTQAVEIALAKQKASIDAAVASMAKPPKGSPKTTMTGKTERSLRNEIDTVRAFRKAGFGTVTPHVDVKTFNKFMADGLRPIPGSKSLRVGALRLFHRSQCQAVTSDEKAKNAKQQAAALARHDKAAKTAKTAKVVPINANPQ
jgi:hypothetical protein